MKFWTALEVRRAIELHRAGQTSVEIGLVLGRTSHQVRALMRRNGLSVPRHQCSDLPKQVLDLHARGLCGTEIAARLGHKLSVTTVYRWLRKAGHTARGHDRAVQIRLYIKRNRKPGRVHDTVRRLDAFRAQAASMGWPQVNHPAAARLLDWLLAHGPATESEIGTALGYSPHKHHKGGVQYQGLRSLLVRMVAQKFLDVGHRPGKTRPFNEYAVAGWLRAQRESKT